MIEEFTFRRLDLKTAIKPFDCGETDLNDFFLKDALNYLRQLLAITYFFENQDRTIAFFSVLNDRISESDSDKRVFRKIKKQMPHKKHYKSYPAVKVGRFGVDQQFHKQGIGTEVLTFIKQFFTNSNKTGCRYITVDAYKKASGFYKKSDFDFLTSTDKTADTRAMYFDLMNFVRDKKTS
ncbi:MAG: GNAT family N-acetyltransferase [Nitrospirae bacterium]|nr:GNAT family N-acetyltransferase [Nitrospirota bacterium]